MQVHYTHWESAFQQKSGCGGLCLAAREPGMQCACGSLLCSDVPRSPVCSDMQRKGRTDTFLMILKMYEKYGPIGRTVQKLKMGAELYILTPHLECIALQDMAPAHPLPYLTTLIMSPKQCAHRGPGSIAFGACGAALHATCVNPPQSHHTPAHPTAFTKPLAELRLAMPS